MKDFPKKGSSNKISPQKESPDKGLDKGILINEVWIKEVLIKEVSIKEVSLKDIPINSKMQVTMKEIPTSFVSKNTCISLNEVDILQVLGIVFSFFNGYHNNRTWQVYIYVHKAESLLVQYANNMKEKKL